MADLTLPDGLIDPTVAPAAGLTAQAFTTPGGTDRQVVHPAADAAHRGQPAAAIDAGQITKDDLCKGVDAGDGAGRLQVAVIDR